MKRLAPIMESLHNIVVPDNTDIYYALLGKASSYSPDKPYQIAAYKRAAATILTYPYSIEDEYNSSDTFLDNTGIGQRIRDFIWEYYFDPQQINYVVRLPTINPNNQPIYDALLVKASEYPSYKTLAIAAYIYAAERIAELDLDVAADYSSRTYTHIPGVGRNIKKFITDFTTAN